ncbi:enoyl-CoA hydratase/isomerase family protein [Xanthobacter sp. TB0139]|uniref:enoyl-CoA hydratase/isomerase family protein n=1 Tax=Xanthobacter sp. TB0139 TaxID=3459178 RepID=UPI00403A578B
MTRPQDAEPLLVSIADGVAELQFNRPNVLNAMNQEAARRFRVVVEQVTQNPEVRVIVLSGAGRAFIAGGDLSCFRESDDPAVVAELIDTLHAPLLRLSQDARPVLASLKGPVAGGGMGVALAADLAIAADDVKFSTAYLAIAASPDCSTSWNLVQILGVRKAMELALLGEVVGGEEALRLGLINRLVPREALEEETRKMARQLASRSLPALARTKALLRAAATRPLPEQMEAEKRAFLEGAATADFHEAVDAFLSRRTPHLQHR